MRSQTFSRAQILHEFECRCQALSASNNRGFKQEFEELKDVGKDLSTKTADLEANREKNRYPYILPYDHCRVRLSIQNSLPNSDYINANFVPGGVSQRDFICTQGPMRDTMNDFWRMVWEQNVRIIVMVTALRYKDLVLCNEYWSLQPGTVYHGLFQVTTVARKQGPDYFISTINIRQVLCISERLSNRSDPNTLPLSILARPGSSKRPIITQCFYRSRAAALGSHSTFGPGCCALQEQYIFVHQCLLYWLSGGKSSCFIHLDHTNREVRRQDRHLRDTHSSEQPSTLQQFLQPRKLLRRLLQS
ncbi:receptor-type tyrosine-protein phosphatase V-like isoform X2 [Stigmatopora argus]